MPRTAKFEPYCLKGREAIGQKPWLLNVPSALSETGKRQQLFFATRREAETAAEQIRTRQRNFGNSLSVMTPARMHEAAEAFLLVDRSALPVSVISLVREGLARHAKRLESCTLDALFEQYITLKQTKSRFHLSKLRACRNRFTEVVGSQLVSDLTHEDFEPVLNGMTPSMRNSQLTLLNSVLNFGVKKELLERNPLGRLDFIDIDSDGEVEVLTPPEVGGLLHAALEHDRELLPFLVLGTFCGIRPVGELDKLLWSDVSLTEKAVTVRAKVSKTGNRRHIPLSDNALAWLRLCELPSTSPSSSKILPCSVNRMHVRRHELWQKVTSDPYPKNAMRHSFCSYWVALHAEEKGAMLQLLLMVGHTSPQMLWDHYYRRVERAEAETFWSIMP
jgi:integrase